MRAQERKGSLVTDIMSGKYNNDIAPNSSRNRPSPVKHLVRTTCPHCGYRFGFDIELGYHSDHQSEIILVHQDREDYIYDLARLNPEGTTFKIIEQWFRDSGRPQPLASLHHVIKKMLNSRVLKKEESQRPDELGRNRKTIIYRAVSIKQRSRSW